MIGERIKFDSMVEAVKAIDDLGAGNSQMMATRAIHINVFVRKVPGPDARFLKSVYNDIGAEAAISHEAYFEENGAITDMIVMGTVYQHREVRRILVGNAGIKPLIDIIAQVVDNAPETGS
jgi:hypothetical protein